MVTKKNEMPKIQTTNNIVLFPTAPSLKNVATTSLNGKKKKKSTRKSLTKRPLNFHNVPEFPPLSIVAIRIPMLLEDHHQQKMVKSHPPTHFFSYPPFHFESTHHLSLGLLHPLGFLNFDHLNNFKHACSIEFVSNDQLTHESF
jgi:hypothetical protein